MKLSLTLLSVIDLFYILPIIIFISLNHVYFVFYLSQIVSGGMEVICLYLMRT